MVLVEAEESPVEECVARAAAESPDAGSNPVERDLACIYTTEAPRLYRYALLLTRRHESAQDAVQEAILRYYVARTAGQIFQNPRAWLFQVVRNHVLDGLRAIRTRNEVCIDGLRSSADSGHDPETTCRSNEIARRLSSSLVPRELDCVRLRAEGLCYAEIGKVLAVKPGTVGAILARAHKKIRKSLCRAGYASAAPAELVGLLPPEKAPYAF